MFSKMKLRLIVLAVETLHNNMVNEWIFSIFLLIEFFCIGESAANLILLSLVPQIQIFDVY